MPAAASTLSEKISELSTEVHSLTAKVIELAFMLGTLTKTVEAHENWINGIGQEEGAKQFLLRLNLRLDGLEKQWGSVKLALWAICLPLIFSILGFFWALLTHSIALIK